MDILLDTHIFLWYISGDPRLSEKNRNIIMDTNNIIYISPVSIWECIIKQDLGKLNLPDQAGKYLKNEREKHKFSPLPIEEEDIIHLHSLPLFHKDPFDRLLICQALSKKLVLLTEDSLIKKYDINTLLG